MWNDFLILLKLYCTVWVRSVLKLFDVYLPFDSLLYFKITLNTL
jgi:hypothetical protein